jgi:gas vesicle protein
MTQVKWAATITGFAIGIGVGALLGVLFAPQSGEEARNYLTGKAKDSLKGAGNRLGEALDAGAEFVSQAHDTVRRAKAEITEQIKEVVGESEIAHREANSAV